MSIMITDPAALHEGFRAFEETWGAGAEPPAITVSCVSALANPAFVIEISAIAVADGAP